MMLNRFVNTLSCGSAADTVKLRCYHSCHLRVSKMHPAFQLNSKKLVKEDRNECISRDLMVQRDILKSASPGTFYMYPLLARALEKLYRVIDESMQSIGAQKIATPCIAPYSLWKKSGRWEEMGAELFQLNDRRKSSHCLAPTHEEAVTTMLAELGSLSHKHLPLKYYQIGRKFRDEMRVKNGLLRCREFEMKDLYTFDTTLEDAEVTYQEVCDAYSTMFKRLGLDYIKVAADSGTMGGSKSEEFLLPSAIGEAKYQLCAKCGKTLSSEILNSKLTDDCEDPDCLKDPGEQSGIEIAHAFLLGSKYSKIFDLKFNSKTGGKQFIQMGCYGIGVTRLLAAAIETLSTPKELRWPNLLAPYQISIIPQQTGFYHDESRTLGEALQDTLLAIPSLHNEVLLDDRYDMSLGKRSLTCRENGIPYCVILGKSIQQETPLYELLDVYSGTTNILTEEQLIDRVSELSTVVV